MKHKGFTLIEFIVIISIFAVMASVALFNFNGFKSNVGLNNLAHDIGLTIRQAQVFGWATQTGGQGQQQTIVLDSLDPLTGNPVRYADGVYFDSATLASQFILYKKLNYTATDKYFTPADTVIDTIKINGPYVIDNILGATNKADLKITQTGQTPVGVSGNTPIVNASIAFTRPKPEAAFFSDINTLNYSYIGIYIRGVTDGAGNASHVVIVSHTGEIDVQ